jgi:hypothetical protein
MILSLRTLKASLPLKNCAGHIAGGASPPNPLFTHRRGGARAAQNSRGLKIDRWVRLGGTSPDRVPWRLLLTNWRDRRMIPPRSLLSL